MPLGRPTARTRRWTACCALADLPVSGQHAEIGPKRVWSGRELRIRLRGTNSPSDRLIAVRLRGRLVLLWLLLTLPVQAVVVASGTLCVMPGNADAGTLTVAGGHHATPLAHSNTSEHHHDVVAQDGDTTSSEPAPPSSTDHGSAKCAFCQSCCFAGAMPPMLISSAVFQDHATEVVPYVDRALASRAVDGLFRPPRTIAL